MRFAGALVLTLFLMISEHAAAQPPAGSKEATSATPSIDPAAGALLDEINSLNAYQSPNLPLKTDQEYAHSVKELEPFHHVEPFRTHFRTQLEYTGPGRSLPEPTGLKSVKSASSVPIIRPSRLPREARATRRSWARRCTRAASSRSRR